MQVKSNFRNDNFLGCFDLPTGGIIIGTIGLYNAILQIITETILFISLFFVESFCIKQNFAHNNFNVDVLTAKTQDDFEDDTNITLENAISDEIPCTEISKFPIGLILLAGIFLNIISLVCHYNVIKGVEEHNSLRFSWTLKFYKFLIGLRAIILILMTIWTFYSVKFILAAMFVSFIFFTDIYFYMIINKLWETFLIEPKITVVVQPAQSIQMPPMPQTLDDKFIKTSDEFGVTEIKSKVEDGENKESYRYLTEPVALSSNTTENKSEKPKILETIDEVYYVDNSSEKTSI